MSRKQANSGGIPRALHYREHGEQTVIICSLMHFSQPKVSVSNQEIIINFVPKEKGNVVNGREEQMGQKKKTHITQS